MHRNQGKNEREIIFEEKSKLIMRYDKNMDKYMEQVFNVYQDDDILVKLEKKISKFENEIKEMDDQIKKEMDAGQIETGEPEEEEGGEEDE